ncbi:hypothetical protein ACIRRA_15800 [Nocardia sp. NPDC101769]|uniref:hypothetical protein n=1 Tax=Nocardia sp. NPDC101769 TaxID=3364333 RepID=UPI00382863A4
MTTASDIGFDYRPGPPEDGRVFQVVPCIDTIALTDLTFGISAGMQPAGGRYGGLVPRFVLFGRAMNHFRRSSPFPLGHKTPVLVCICGEFGCWGLLTRVALTGNVVVWDCFEPPYRTDRDDTPFGPFLFDRGQYDKAVQALSAEVDVDE